LQAFSSHTPARSSDSDSPVLPSLPLPPADWSLSSSFAKIELEPPMSSLWPPSISSTQQHKPCVCCRCVSKTEAWPEIPSRPRHRHRPDNVEKQTTPNRTPTPIQRPSPARTNTPSSLTLLDDDDDGTLRLHVSNIPFTWSKEKLADVFGQYGTTFDVEVVYNERGSKGFGFVTFLAKKDALEAKRRMDREIVDGRRLVVNFAKPKQKTPGSKDPHPSSGGNTHHAFKKPNSYSDRSNRVQQPLGFSTPPTARRQHLSGFSSLSSTPTRPTSTNNTHRYYL